MSKTAKARYEALVPIREPYLVRARECSALTLPFLFPPLKTGKRDGAEQYDNPYNSIGPRGLKNLTAKLLMALFPPGKLFFREAPDIVQLEEAAEEAQDTELKQAVEKQLSQREQVILKDFDSTISRTVLTEILQHLLVGGNIAFYLPTNTEGVRTFHLSNYVVKRNEVGEVLEAIVLEHKPLSSLPKKIIQLVDLAVDPKEPHQEVEVYTWLRRMKNGDYKSHQEINNKKVPETDALYKADNFPWLFLQFFPMSGEDYARSFLEQHLGELITLEGLTGNFIETSAVLSRVVWLLRKGTGLKAKKFKQSNNTDVHEVTDLDAVTAVTANLNNDLAVVQAEIERINRSLSLSFLLNSSVQRDAERVTREEVRFMISELEDGVSGFYSFFSKDFQLKVIKLRINRLIKMKRITKLPADAVDTKIITGMDALGRGRDLEKLTLFMQQAIALGGGGVTEKYVDMGSLLERMATSMEIDTEGLIRSDEQIQQQVQQEQAAAMGQQVAPEIIKQTMEQEKDDN